jgi:hypothetical protein
MFVIESEIFRNNAENKMLILKEFDNNINFCIPKKRISFVKGKQLSERLLQFNFIFEKYPENKILFLRRDATDTDNFIDKLNKFIVKNLYTQNGVTEYYLMFNTSLVDFINFSTKNDLEQNVQKISLNLASGEYTIENVEPLEIKSYYSESKKIFFSTCCKSIDKEICNLDNRLRIINQTNIIKEKFLSKIFK